MPTNHDARAAVPVTPGANSNRDLTRSLLVGRYAYCLGDDENPRDLIALDPDKGVVIPVILYQRQVFWLDETDATTAHDGITCLVSYDNKRFKIADTLGTTGVAPPQSIQNINAALWWAQLHRYRTPFAGAF